MNILDDPTLASTNLDQPCQVHTIIDFWGGAGILNTYEAVYGVELFGQNDAPILILHGDEDQTVKFSKAEELESIYKSTGVGYAFYPLIGHGHSAWDAEVDGMSLSELTFNFIVEQQGLVVSE